MLLRIQQAPGITNLIPVWSHTSVEIDHEIISMVILLPSAVSRNVVVSYKRKYVHGVLANCLVKLAQEKVWLGELTVPPWQYLLTGTLRIKPNRTPEKQNNNNR